MQLFPIAVTKRLYNRSKDLEHPWNYPKLCLLLGQSSHTKLKCATVGLLAAGT